MSTTIKGSPGPILAHREISYDAATGSRTDLQTWQGTAQAIAGMTPGLESSGYSWRILTGPIWELQANLTSTNETTEDIDRWEVSTSSHEASIFSHPDVVTASVPYDAARQPGEDTWREIAEQAVQQKNTISPADVTFPWVVQHLRAGITGYQLDTVILRRFRKISNEFAYAGGRITLRGAQYRYTTPQLNIPTNVAFRLPDEPAGYSWLLRSQKVDIVGSQTEQSFEFEFADWSTDIYAASGVAFNW